jgi:hypothetical protein
MITLWLKDTRTLIGSIEDADLRLLVDQLEEESETDVDYYISQATVDILEKNGASAQMVALLRKAVGDSEGVDITWAEE